MRRIATVLAALLVAFASSAGLNAAQQAQQHQRVEDERRVRLEREIDLLDRQLRENASKSSNALSKLTLVRKQVSNRRSLISKSDHEIAVYNDRITAKQREINRLQARLDTMQVYYARLVRSAYKNRDARVWYMYLLSSGSVSQAARRYGYLRGLSGTMNAQALKIRQTRTELEAQQQEIFELKKAAEKLRERREQELKALRADEKTSAGVVTQLKRQKTRYQKQLAEKKRQMEALERELAKAVSVKSSKPIDYKLAGEFESNKGRLPWPVDGVVVDRFGQHYHPVYKSVKLPFNNGVTLATAKAAPVRAVFGGVVKQVIVMPGYNQCVLLQHGNYFTFYCKMGSVKVKAGSKVNAGDVLGTVDTISGETQFHFQLWKEKKPQNPESWLR